MATITGTHVNFVKVPTMAKFNDITTKVDGTVYFIVDAKKIYLDGIMYGFNDSDVNLSPYFKHDGSIIMTGNINFDESNNSSINNVNYLSNGGNHLDLETPALRRSGGLGIAIMEDYIRFYTGSESGASARVTGVETIADVNQQDGSEVVNLQSLKDFVIYKKGVANGYATLDNTGKVPSSELPSYVDDIVEYANKASFPATGESGKLYVDLATTYLWRWSGTAYINVSDGNAPLTLGTNSTTAYRGDRGKIAYDHTQLTGTTDNPHFITKINVGLGSVENYGIASEAEAKAGSSSSKYMTPQRTKQAIEELAPKLAWTVVS